MINWKLIVGFAGFALLLSILTGAINGVGGGEVLLRALIWGSLFALLGFGISVAIDKLLPDLKNMNEPGKVQPPAEKGGVDISLPSENPHDGQTGDEEEFLENLTDGQVGESSDDTEIKTDLNSKTAKHAQTPDDNDKSWEKGERDIKSDDLEPLEDIAKNDTGSIGEELDTLPDLEKFAGSFSSFNDMGSSPNEGSTFQTPMKDNVEIAGAKEDPAKVAKAIHTWIERDKEG